MHYLLRKKNNSSSSDILKVNIKTIFTYGTTDTNYYLFTIFVKKVYSKFKSRFLAEIFSNSNQFFLSNFKKKNPSLEYYSLSGQDLFVSSLIPNSTKTNYYVEIGAGWPIKINNTYLLESIYHWRGLSVDLDPKMVENFNDIRSNKCLAADATKIDYSVIFETERVPKVVDYLSLDIDPAEQTLMVLTLIPFSNYDFKIITFEHDSYKNGYFLKKTARLWLTHYGYSCVGKDIKARGFGKYEDWWINPRYISYERGKTAVKRVTTILSG